MATTVFVSGHLDLTKEEFAEHYVPRLQLALARGCDFVVGDAHGCDFMVQRWLREHGATCTVFHMFDRPRHSFGSGYGSHDPNLPKESWSGPRGGFPLRGGFQSDDQRDSAMTACSQEDIAWVRPGREGSGTARNVRRREAIT